MQRRRVDGAHTNLTCAGKRLPFFALHQEPVAQLVEHRTFNAVVAGSSPPGSLFSIGLERKSARDFSDFASDFASFLSKAQNIF